MTSALPRGTAGSLTPRFPLLAHRQRVVGLTERSPTRMSLAACAIVNKASESGLIRGGLLQPWGVVAFIQQRALRTGARVSCAKI